MKLFKRIDIWIGISLMILGGFLWALLNNSGAGFLIFILFFWIGLTLIGVGIGMYQDEKERAEKERDGICT